MEVLRWWTSNSPESNQNYGEYSRLAWKIKTPTMKTDNCHAVYTITGGSGDDKIGIMATLGFQCILLFSQEDDDKSTCHDSKNISWMKTSKCWNYSDYIDVKHLIW